MSWYNVAKVKKERITMHPSIQTVYEGKRGCGFRKVHGLYLRSDGETMQCGKFPLELTVCPCCGNGIKPARGFTWIDLAKLAVGKQCKNEGHQCNVCPASQENLAKIVKCGLIWVGEKFYKTPNAFVTESFQMGISRRINFVPKDFVVGETWVALAHEKAIPHLHEGAPATFTPAIFSLFLPDRIEIVVTGEESDEEIEGYLKRKLTPVKVINPQKEMFTEEMGAE